MSQRVLGYASYRVDDTVHSFDSAPAARAAFERALATAKTSKSKKAIDATGPQADRDDGKLVRVWVTVGWTHSKRLDDWAWLAP